MDESTTSVDRPQLAAGLVLLGEYEGSGFTEPHYLAVRGDGQVLHLSRLLHLVAAHADGRRSLGQLAGAVSDAYDRVLDEDGAAYLVDTKLRPMGVLAPLAGISLDEAEHTAGESSAASGFPAADGSAGDPPGDIAEKRAMGMAQERVERATPPPRATPLLALRARGTLLPAAVVRPVSRALAQVFAAPVVFLVVLLLAVGDAWLFATADLVGALTTVLGSPVATVSLLGALFASTIVHELGHAAACAAGGGRPGRIGVGLYLVYPAFFTDVTDSYRLDRVARVRTDLGGVYFNGLTIVALTGAYAATGHPVLLVALALVHVEAIQQLVPLGRLDGYFVLADLAGVPDLFGRIGPILRSALPGRPTPPKVAELRPSARRWVVAWVAVCVPVMVGLLGWALWQTPVMARQIWWSLGRGAQRLAAATAGGDWASALLAVVSLLLLPLPLLGLAWLVANALRQLAQATRWPRRSADPADGTRQPGPAGPTGPTGERAAMGGIRRIAHLRRPHRPPPPHPHPAGRPGKERENPMSGSDDTHAPGAPSSTLTLAPCTEPATPPRTAAPTRATPVAHEHRAEELAEPWLLGAPAPMPTQGWRHLVHAASGGRVNPGPGPAERRQAALLDRVRTPIPGSRRIVVLSRKGGVGKTTTSLMLGHTFATHRGDRVVALDANPDAGSLALRMRRETRFTATDLLAERAFIDRYAHLRAFTSQDVHSRLEVVASDDDPGISRALGADDYRQLIDVLDRHFNLVILDTGTGILDDAIQGILAEADQLVVVLGPAVDGGRVAAMTLDWLDQHGHAALVAGAVAVINGVRAEGRIDLGRLREHFRSRCRAVLDVPWDPALGDGGSCGLAEVRQATRSAYLDLAAVIAEGFCAEVRAESRGRS